MYKIVNIKKDFPDSEYAIFLMEKEIEFAKKEGINVVVFVHGYGSSGNGGKIKKEVENRLLKLKKENIIKTFVAGDRWSDTSNDVKLICDVAPELSISSQVRNINSGVTIVLI